MGSPDDSSLRTVPDAPFLYTSGSVLWQFVSKDKKETVVCGVRLHSEANPYIYLFYPQGLDADMKYEDTATGKVYTGAALMKAGLPLPLTTGDYQPIRFTFKAVEK